MGNVRHRLREQWQVCGDRARLFDFAVGGERADAHDAGIDGDAGQPGHAGDIHQQVGRGQAHVERREQALAAREDFGAVAVTLEQIERFGERSGLRVGERGGFHGCASFSCIALLWS
jgi:hypothetical protein